MYNESNPRSSELCSNRESSDKSGRESAKFLASYATALNPDTYIEEA